MRFESSTQTIGWIREQYQEDKLTIKPPYQRRPVWQERQKCALIETILKRFPVPEIYIQRYTDEEGTTQYAIVDGQQRVRTVIQFAGSEKDDGEVEFNDFSLDKLPEGSDYYGMSMEDLNENQRKRFYDYSFAVRFLLTEDDDEVRDVFKRLNKYLTALNPQELRNSTYRGPFISLANKLADDEYWSLNGLVSPALIRRMKDVEFVSDLLIGMINGPQDGKASVIDDFYEKYEGFTPQIPKQKHYERLFDDTLDLIYVLFPNVRDEERWDNRTDFYTLFVALSELLETQTLVKSRVRATRIRLQDFAADVDLRLGDESEKSTEEVIAYVRAVEKGANGLPRRRERHRVLLPIVQEMFKDKS